MTLYQFINGIEVPMTHAEEIAYLAEIAAFKANPTGAMVNTERDRRIVQGSMFDVDGYGTIAITGREEDKVALTGLLLKAQGAVAAGVTDPIMTLRDRDNVNHSLTPGQMIDLVMQGMAWIQATMQVSWDMKDATGDFPEGIPADFTDDAHWP